MVSTESSHWTTVFCSDVLYEQSLCNCFLRLVRKLKFDELILGYKRRKDSEERRVIESLEHLYDVKLIEPSSFELKNLQKDDTVGLYLLRISPIRKNVFES